jgi:isocitrate lyase
VGTGYFDEITQTLANGQSAITAMEGSTETEQFNLEKAV